ncbi:MAG: class I SAM-dependent methyltransferase, partial [candidate division Zixibacteria bacterium]|nr:class I SAM-dependent methyltransferase [candidate division Zixibacteria bacterium]
MNLMGRRLQIGMVLSLVIATCPAVAYSAEEDFRASEREVTLGRYIKSNGAKDFVALVAPTPRAANAAPVVGPVVIQELFYHPDDVNASEFVELRNITDQPVSLAGWYFDGIRFTFPENASIEPDGLVIVVPVTPDEFRLERGLPETVIVFGPYLGKLDNAGESFKLFRPGEPEEGGLVPAFLIDRVTYDDKDPWPIEADGQGASLQRIAPDAFGNDPQNWVASVGGTTPGDITAQVTQVLVGSSQWSPAFLAVLEARGLGEGGFSILTGPDQLTPLSQQFVDRITLLQGDSCDVLHNLSHEARPDVVYIDPMYPSSRKAALAKKEMRVCRRLVGDDDDATALL